jgi:hypothetical protein
VSWCTGGNLALPLAVPGIAVSLTSLFKAFPAIQVYRRNPKIRLAGSIDDGIFDVIFFLKVSPLSLYCCRSTFETMIDQLGDTITSLLKSELPFGVATSTPWVLLLFHKASFHSGCRLKTLQEVGAAWSWVQ